MEISEALIQDVLGALPADERELIFKSTSIADARTALTKFSAALTAKLLGQLKTDGGRIVHATFKGNKSGRSGGGAGGLEAIAHFTRSLIEEAKHTFQKGECLLDFVVSGADLLDISMTVESEARPIAAKTGLYDLEKLLLVSSPLRIYIGRVNVPKRGNTRKIREATDAIQRRFSVAKINGHLRPSDIFNALLFQTCSDTIRVLHLARCKDEKLQFERIELT